MELYTILTEFFYPTESFEINQVLDNLWITNVYTAQNSDILNHNNIKHVVSLYPVHLPDYNQLYINIYDFTSSDIQQHLDTTYVFIEEALEAKEGVLVHCHVGRSRAAAIVIYYLMKKYKMTYEKAYAFLKTKRPLVQPNQGFINQLKELEIVMGVESI